MQGAGPCLPQDANYGSSLLQRDVYLMPRDGKMKRKQPPVQTRFTFHGMRLAEICCTKDPPRNVYAIQYRTKFPEWGNFDSSNTTLNAAYEIVKNSFDSNAMGIQSDCPHREKLQYGGDISANSVAAMHYFDLSAFYDKIIEDWTESQWDNGAYTVTSVFMNLLVDRSIIRRGAGETVWASLPPVLSCRHMHHYGDVNLLERTLLHHIKWVELLNDHWDEGMCEEVFTRCKLGVVDV
jgi:alpha-L-rhamnosidase